MKKALFATTALVATSGVAFADISISGYAEMGVFGGDGHGIARTQFHSDFHVDFKGSVETDGGLTAGFSARLDKSTAGDNDPGPGTSGVNGPTKWDSETVFISGAFGTLTMGQTDGAYDWAMQEVGIGTTIADDHTSHAGFNFNSGLDGTYDDQVLRYDHSFGDFSFAASIELDDDEITDSRDNIAVGVKYDLAIGGIDLGLGVAYAQGSEITAAVPAVEFVPGNDGPDGMNGTADDVAAVMPVAAVPASAADADIIGLSASANMDNGLKAQINISEHSVDGGADTTHIGLGLGFTTGPVTVMANYGEYDRSGGADSDGFGVAVNYDLGGGVVAMAGFGDSDGDNNEKWSLGLGMSF